MQMHVNEARRNQAAREVFDSNVWIAVMQALVTANRLHHLHALRVGADHQQAVLLKQRLSSRSANTAEVQQRRPICFHRRSVQLSPIPSRHTRTVASMGNAGSSSRQMKAHRFSSVAGPRPAMSSSM